MRGALVLLALAGCQHIPQELLDARREYQTAEETADLTAARLALEQATREVQLNGGSERAKDLAYIARRRIEAANARARAAADRHQLVALNVEAVKLKNQQRVEIEQQAAALPPVPLAPPPPPPKVAVAESPTVEVAESPLAVEPAPLDALTSFARVKEDEAGTSITIPAALVFVAGQAGLTYEARERLDQVAAMLKARTERISIDVHTDNVGPRGANVALSKRRAKAVVDYLVAQGLSRDRIESHGLADTQPLVDNETPENRAMNRRLEILLHAKPVS